MRAVTSAFLLSLLVVSGLALPTTVFVGELLQQRPHLCRPRQPSRAGISHARTTHASGSAQLVDGPDAAFHVCL